MTTNYPLAIMIDATVDLYGCLPADTPDRPPTRVAAIQAILDRMLPENIDQTGAVPFVDAAAIAARRAARSIVGGRSGQVVESDFRDGDHRPWSVVVAPRSAPPRYYVTAADTDRAAAAVIAAVEKFRGDPNDPRPYERIVADAIGNYLSRRCQATIAGVE